MWLGPPREAPRPGLRCRVGGLGTWSPGAASVGDLNKLWCKLPEFSGTGTAIRNDPTTVTAANPGAAALAPFHHAWDLPPVFWLVSHQQELARLRGKPGLRPRAHPTNSLPGLFPGGLASSILITYCAVFQRVQGGEPGCQKELLRRVGVGIILDSSSLAPHVAYVQSL